MKSNEEKRQANAEYWRQRVETTKDVSMQKADKFIADMEREYKVASRNIELEVTDFLSRFAENEQMTLSNARKRLNAHELKEFRMELEEYIRKGEENGISADWTKQLESASLLHRIDRLQALKMQIDNQIEALAAYKEQGLNKTLGEIFEENYYRNIFDVQQMMGEGTAFAILDGRRIMQAISKPWRYDGKTFSDSIWENKEKLKYSLERTLTQGIIRGSAPRKIAEAIAKETGRELYAAKRLVLTESAKMAEKASEEGYKELGVKEIEIVVALDERTCEVCGEMDGKHFPLDKAEGLTPPFHPNCRCTTVPYFNDEFTQGEERAAKGEDGKTYYVPADMTYKEWREKYVEGAVNAPEGEGKDKNDVNGFNEKSFKDSLNTILDNSNGNASHVLNMRFYAEKTDYIRLDKLKAPFAYLPKYDVIAYNPTNPYIEYYDMDYVMVHELTHKMDILQYHSWENEAFNKAIELSRKKVYDNFEEIQKLFWDGGKYEMDAALSDIMSALTNNKMKLAYGHKEWGKIANEEQMEIFANISSMDILNKKYDEPIRSALSILFEAYKGVVD